MAGRERSKLLTTVCKVGVRGEHEPTCAKVRQGCERSVELLFSAGVQNMKLHAECFGSRIEVPQLRRRGGAGRVDDHSEGGGGREQFVHELQPLARDLHAQARYARDITPWS